MIGNLLSTFTENKIFLLVCTIVLHFLIGVFTFGQPVKNISSENFRNLILRESQIYDQPYFDSDVKKESSLFGSKILVYTKNGEGYVHENIPYSVKAIRELGTEYGFAVDHSEDPAVFTDQNLQQYNAIIFSNTNNKTIDTKKQKEAFQRYIQSGGGFVGIHSASGSERDWPWFWELLGGKFKRHAPQQDFVVDVINANHPSTSFLPVRWQIADDECYYLHHLNPGIHVLLAADLTTVDDEQKNEYPNDIFGDAFPLAWYHEFENGRSWYTALGHKPEHYSDPTFMKHILGGIRWAVDNSEH